MTANRETRRAAAKAAKRPPARTVDVTLPAESPFAGWHVVARADFPAGILADLTASDDGAIVRIIDALDRIVLEHNLPDELDNVAGSMRDVDPYDGLIAIAGAIFDAIGTLPNR